MTVPHNQLKEQFFRHQRVPLTYTVVLMYLVLSFLLILLGICRRPYLGCL